MVLVEYSAGLPCSTDQAWKVLRDFGGIAEWHPAIVKSGIESEVGILRVGAVRRLELADGGVLRERLIEFDDGLRALAYVFEESPLPVDGYRAQVRVDEVAGLVERCVVRWSARFEVREVGTEAEFEGLVRGLIVQGHEGLEGVIRVDGARLRVKLVDGQAGAQSRQGAETTDAH